MVSKHYIVDNTFLCPPLITFREIHYRQYMLRYYSVILLLFLCLLVVSIHLFC